MIFATLILIGLCLMMCSIVFEHKKHRAYFKKLGEFLLAKDVEWD